MRFLGSVLVAGIVVGAGIFAAGMVMDTMENKRFWHQVKPGDGN